jgi:hypothetical protein
MSDNDQTGDDSQGITTLEGRVEFLGNFPRGKFGDTSEVRHSGLVLKTEDGRIVIHLGPAAYFLQNNFQIKAGETLKVTGTRIMRGEGPLIQAREVKIRRKQLKLRDQNGLPLWRFPSRDRTY